MAIDYMKPSCFSWVIVIALVDFDVKNDLLYAVILSVILSLAVACDAVYSSVVEDFLNSYLCVVLLHALLEQTCNRSCAHRPGGHHVGLQIVEHPLRCLASDGE